MKFVCVVCRWAVLLLLTTAALGTILRVPEDYSTIQMALDSLASGDTVLVAAGIYNESLQAPDDYFMLQGLVTLGGDPEQPIIDPSPLEGSTHLACLTLPANSGARIKHITFRNGPWMFPREHGSDVGGVKGSGDSLTIERCSFDSTYIGLRVNAGRLTVDSCDFVDNLSICLRDASSSRTRVSHTSFAGRGDLLAWFNDSTLLNYCQFHEKLNGGEWIWLTGAGITVRECTFGPTTVPAYSIIWTADSRGCRFENNLFHNLEVMGTAVSLNGVAGDTSRFLGNIFRQNQAVVALNAGGGLWIDGDASLPPDVLLTNNHFDSCRAFHFTGFGALQISLSRVSLDSNFFIGPGLPLPYVRISPSPYVNLRNCHFEHTTRALHSLDFQNTVHATFNWWGDSTGPYHPDLNPGGLGDTIVGLIEFIPWLGDTTTNIPTIGVPLPRTCRMTVFPNPFNASAVLQLTVDQPGLYEVELYNLLGQRVREIWEGPITYRKQITLNGQALSSGVYFVRAVSTDLRSPAVLAKIALLR